MKDSPNTIQIDGVKYIRGDSINTPAEKQEGLEYVMVRTYSAGVYAGYLASQNGKEVVLVNARRIWCWSGAAEIGELAQRGTSKPEECKFPAPVSEVRLTEAIEIIPITEQAKATIDAVKIWTE